MATSDGKVIISYPKKQRDARQMAGLATLGFIGLLVALALGATLVTGWQGKWALNGTIVANVALFTLWQAILSVFLSLALGIPVALAMDSLHSFFGRRFILLAFTLPLALPVIIVIMALLILLGRNGMISQLSDLIGLNWRPDIYGLTGILIAHIFFNMPLAVRMIMQRFQTIAQEQWKLAESLKFSAWDRFYVLHLPALRSVLPGISSLIFLLCVGSYSIILVLGGGPRSTTLQVAIYQALSFDFDLGRAAMLTLMQLIITGILVTALPNMAPLHFQGATLGMRRYHRISARNKIICAFTISVAVLFVVLPLMTIVGAGLNTNHAKILGDPLFWQALGTSVSIGLFSSLLALGAAWMLAAASYSYETKETSVLAMLLRTLPQILLTIPPLVLGVGWFLCALYSGSTGSFAPLLIVMTNAIMALPFAFAIIQPSLHTHYFSTDRLAAALGLNGMTRLRLIDLPVLCRPLMTGGLFAFSLSLGDMGVVTLFGADQIITLPALIFQKMGSYRAQDAEGLALYLAVITGFIAYLALRVERYDGI